MENYKLSFEKNINDSFMFIEDIKINKNCYEAVLLKNENIDRLLKFYITDNNGTQKLRYDISNLISLESYIKKNILDKKEISFIINEIYNMLKLTENYLISENSIILNPKTIMVALSTDKKLGTRKKLYFTAIPEYNGDFYMQLVKLLIFILKNTNKTDKKAILFSYTLFCESSKENFTINNLMNIVNQDEQNDAKQVINISDSQANTNTDVQDKNYINENKTKDELLQVNEPAIAYENTYALNNNEEIYLDPWTQNMVDTKYVSDYMEQEENRKNIEYLKSLELDNINEGYDLDTLKAYRDKMVENSNINRKVFAFNGFISLKTIFSICFGIMLPLLIKYFLGYDALIGNIRYIIAIEVVLLGFIAVDFIDYIMYKKSITADN